MKGIRFIMLLSLPVALLATVGTAGAAVGDTTLLSTSDTGTKGNLNSQVSSISGDGITVAFESAATNLDPLDSSSVSDVYVKNLATGNLTLASTDDNGIHGNGASTDPSLSSDGTKVAFESTSTNLDPADTDSTSDVYVKNLATGDIRLASIPGGGIKGNNFAINPAMSGDGARVAFSTLATNLDARDTDGFVDVYVKDLSTGALTLESTSDTGTKGDRGGTDPSLSHDGTKVAFASLSGNLDPADIDLNSDIYLKDLATGNLTLASTTDNGAKAGGSSAGPSLAAGGTRLAFHSTASNLDPADLDSFTDIFVKDLGTGDVQLASTSTGGTKSNGSTFLASLSADGSRVAFHSTATNLDPIDTNADTDVYVKDLVTGTLVLASTASGGTIKGNGPSMRPSLSAGGEQVAFDSTASNLDPDDVDNTADVFVKELESAAAGADLSVSISDSPDPMTQYGVLSYVLTVSNAGPDPATGVTLNDSLPSGSTALSVARSQGTCVLGSTTVDCALGTIASGGTATVTIRVVPTSAGIKTTSAVVSATEADPDVTNDTDSESAQVNTVVCTITGTNAANTLTGGSGNDVICGLGGNDTIDGAGGDDVLVGGTGGDNITGGTGNDSLLGGDGNDTLNSTDGMPGNDLIAGGTGTDTCTRDGPSGGVAGDGRVTCP